MACLGWGTDSAAQELSAQQIADALRNAKHMVISDVRKDPGSPNDSAAPWCRKFWMTSAQVRAYLTSATPITPQEWHYEHQQMPCSMSGKARVGDAVFEWDINASADAHVWQPGRGSAGAILTCGAGCKARGAFKGISGGA